MSQKTCGGAGGIFVFRFVAALVCREQILFLNSSRNQEQPRPGTAGGALVSKLPSWRRSALSSIRRAASVGIADVGFWGRSGNLCSTRALLVLTQTAWGSDYGAVAGAMCRPEGGEPASVTTCEHLAKSIFRVP